MLLRSLTLTNIRSYTKQTIRFQNGSTLLSGDIGSGKSTILLAIEFALFGASRPDLPSELLLRTGASFGSVELCFELEGRLYTVERHLKKEKGSIKQTSGSLTIGGIDGIRKELTPLELKSEIVRLLGYPNDLSSKNKNYLFRYTLYTPQEEMKLILEEDEELRLKILRRLFSLDKYQIIRENAAHYLKTIRSQLTIYETRLEPYQDLQREHQQLADTIVLQQAELADKRQQHLQAEHNLQQANSNLLEIEQSQKHIQSLIENIKTASALIREKEEQITATQNQIIHLQQERLLLRLPQDGSESAQREVIAHLQSEKDELQKNKAQLNERLQQIQSNLKELKPEIDYLTSKLSLQAQDDKLITRYTSSLERKPSLEQQRDDLQNKTANIQAQLAKYQAIIDHSKHLQDRLRSLQQCPTCLQEVTALHRHTIIQTEQSKISPAENELSGKERDLQAARNRLSEINSILDTLHQENIELTQLRERRSQRRSLQDTLQQKTERLRTLLEENNQLISRLSTMQIDHHLDRLSRRLVEQHDLLLLYAKANTINAQLANMSENLRLHTQVLSSLQLSRSQRETELSSLADPLPRLEAKKKEVRELQQNEKQLSIEIARLETSISEHSFRLQDITSRISRLTAQKDKLARLQAIHHWLDEHFLQLTTTIERHLMITIHRQFNALFQDWFTTIMEDENISVSIDHSFTPQVIQNGHEISYHHLSGGEKTSIALAYRLSLNRVINDVVHTIKTKDILILDEPTDGFSTEQLDKVRDVLERLHLSQTILVSHEHKIETFVKHIIQIEKVGHVSRAISS